MNTQEMNTSRFMSDINVTPMVDVMLVLLIIFMATAPMMMQGVDVHLPQTQTRNIKTQEDPLILSVNNEKKIFIETTGVKLEELEIKIRSIFQYRRDKEVIIRADKDVPYGFVLQVMAGVKRAGIEKLNLATEPMD